MKYVSKSKLKPKIPEYLRQVEETGEPIAVTLHRVPVFKIVPIQKSAKLSDVFGKYWGKVKNSDNMMQPKTNEWHGDW